MPVELKGCGCIPLYEAHDIMSPWFFIVSRVSEIGQKRVNEKKRPSLVNPGTAFFIHDKLDYLVDDDVRLPALDQADSSAR